MSASWHEDDTFWEASEEFLFRSFADETATRQEAQNVIRLLELDEPGSRLLDLGCGTGRHALELQRQGLEVTGVDRTRPYVEKARKAASEEGLAVELVVGDMRSFRRDEAFDAAISMFSTFGYFSEPEEERRVLDNFHASLKPGGRLLMELHGKEILARGFQKRTWVSHPDGDGFLLEEREIRPGWCWADNRWILVGSGEPQELRWSIRIYSSGEIEALLRVSSSPTKRPRKENGANRFLD